VTVENRSHLIEKCHRRAAEARRLADTPGVSLDERDDLLVVERRWLSLAACFGGRIESAPAQNRTGLIRAYGSHLGCLTMNYRSDAVWANSDILFLQDQLRRGMSVEHLGFLNRPLDEVR
jgi:hypothetical protein